MIIPVYTLYDVSDSLVRLQYPQNCSCWLVSNTLVLLAGSADGPGELVGLGGISVGGADPTGVPGAYCGQEDLHLPEVGVSIGETLHLLLISVTWGVAGRQTDRLTHCDVRLDALADNRPAVDWPVAHPAEPSACTLGSRAPPVTSVARLPTPLWLSRSSFRGALPHE